PRHAADVDPASRGELDVPPGARVDLQQLEPAVARVALELGAEDAPVRQLPEQGLEAFDRAGHVAGRDAPAIGAVAEIGRVDPEPPPAEDPGDGALTVAEAVDEVVVVGAARHVLLHDHAQAQRIEPAPVFLQARAILDPDPLATELAVEPL